VKLSDKSYDIVVIGGGVGGYVAALRAAALGASTALVEQLLIGGTCLNVGCIPTKALLESCRILKMAARAAEFGIGIDRADPDREGIVARSRKIVDLMRGGVENLLARAGVEIIRGTARLASPTGIEVTSDGGPMTLEAKAIIVATGSAWITLPGVEIDGERVITSDHAVGLKGFSESLVIVGAGAVGCEFAEIYRALGSDVTIVEMMDQVLPGEDTELARRLEASLKRKGIKVLTSARVAGLEKHKDGLLVKVDGGADIATERLLVGIGRRPNTAGIGLEEAGVGFSRSGIEVDPGMRTNVPGIFAVGDVTGKYLLAHVALAQGIVAAENACGADRLVNYEAVPRCVYTDPEYAAVGMTEAEAAAGGLKPRVFRVRLGQIGRALTLGETFGLAKMVVEEATGRVLGFQALAPHASEMLAETALAIETGMKAEDMARVIHPHPTLSEIVREAAEGAAGRAIHG
jgi:dihydrolipoamide dehydrogenase